MRTIVMAAIATAAVFATGPVVAEPGAPTVQAYTPVPVAADERSGPSRRINCSVGEMHETTCTFTPLFGDGSFQLDGPDIAIRLIISDGEAYLFEVIGPTRRIAIGGVYTRDPHDRACWVSKDGGPTPVCAR